MNQDGGWIELVDPTTRQVRARAHLRVSDVPFHGGWHGALESVRVTPGGSFDSGTYLARFTQYHDACAVEIDVSSAGARVHCDDVQLPSVLRELSEGE